MKLFFASLTFVLLLASCKKNSSVNNEVLIRVENASADDFSNFTFMDKSFGSIAIGDTSSYSEFENVLPYPFANLIAINNNYLYIEDIVPTPFLESGKYLLQVVDDSAFRYKANFIKE